MTAFLKPFRPAAVLLALLTIATGVFYPLAVTGVSQFLFPGQANGSLRIRQGRIVGSRLIGQPFSDPGHFWSRPSATAPFPYNAASSSGSNLGPTNPALAQAREARLAALSGGGAAPADLLTSSASGLDPHISPEAALYQVGRVARARKLPEDRLRELISRRTEGRLFGLFGEPRVNVLLLNLDLDSLPER